ncbi:serpin-Z10-like [Rhododendron vialii]|uniref:serpin-Z10-like n=1 Tax=Rhododendron vialii TaxID=182163 RepID=UPI00265F8E90|nr:serpin-Z10-like [Rhododendron vialii]
MRDGLQNLVGKFNSDFGFLSQEYFELTEVTLDEFWILKFKFSFDFNVIEIMDDMGGPFSRILNLRDFSEMVHNTEKVEALKIKMFQKAYIEVDEEGTKIAAITHLHFVNYCAAYRPKNKRYNFVADHPFVFMIREEGSADQVADEINSWANITSRDLIKEILQHGSIDPKIVLIRANGLYFKGFWDSDYKFDARRTKKRKFCLLDGSIVSVPFMASSKDYYYGSFDGLRSLKFHIRVAYPTIFPCTFFSRMSEIGLQNLVGKLNLDSGFLCQEYFKLIEETLDEFWIPKFKFSFNFNVLEVMNSDMGVPFSRILNLRDLSGMIHNTKKVEALILKMFQKAYIEVDEKGTGAAAITHLHFVAYCATSRPENKRYNFVVDHPFVFMIREERSDCFCVEEQLEFDCFKFKLHSSGTTSTAFAFASTIACVTIREFSCMRIEEQKST